MDLPSQKCLTLYHPVPAPENPGIKHLQPILHFAGSEIAATAKPRLTHSDESDRLMLWLNGYK